MNCRLPVNMHHRQTVHFAIHVRWDAVQVSCWNGNSPEECAREIEKILSRLEPSARFLVAARTFRSVILLYECFLCFLSRSLPPASSMHPSPGSPEPIVQLRGNCSLSPPSFFSLSVCVCVCTSQVVFVAVTPRRLLRTYKSTSSHITYY